MKNEEEERRGKYAQKVNLAVSEENTEKFGKSIMKVEEARYLLLVRSRTFHRGNFTQQVQSLHLSSDY